MTPKRLATATAAVVAAGAIGAPAAGAQSGDLRSPDVQDLAAAQQRAHDRAQDERTPDARDFAEGRRIVPSTPVKVVEVRYVTRDGFDARDAAVGAAGTLGVVLLGAGGTMVVARRRREPSDDLVPAT
jgi:hypothetical protein